MEIKIIYFFDKLFPDSLKKIINPPKCLFCRGNLSLLSSPKSIAIIGSRDCSATGKEKTKELTSFLVKNNFTIISGLAKGIDAMAHKTTIENKGKTIAVLGSGIDSPSIYPKENLKLAIEIIEADGLIISEYSSGTQPKKEYFPKRNRIIVGLANAVLVPEFKEKSGTMAAMKIAINQKKPIFVTSPIFLNKDMIEISSNDDIINTLTKIKKGVD